MKIIGKYFVLLCIISFSTFGAKAQEATAISSNPGPGLHVALNWDPVKDAVKYNVYRRNESDVNYPITPLNITPVQILTSCTEIKSLLITSPDSADWKLMARGLADKNTLFNPCLLDTVSTISERYNRLKALAKVSMPIAIVAGCGYKDANVTTGNVYYYKIVALNASNAVIKTVASDMKVTAGLFVALPAPSGIMKEAGDDAILIIWDSVPGAAGYILERSQTAIGIFKQVNASQYPTNITKHLNGETLVPAMKGMLDFTRYGPVTGKDTSHNVNGASVYGPLNGTSYYYKVKAIDLFKRPGTASGVVGPAIPQDSTSPSVPMDISTVTNDATGQVTIRWAQVVKNINDHWERPDSTVRYRLYRFTNTDNPDSVPSTYLGEVNTIKGLRFREFTDSVSSLRSIYGNKKWWYRLRSIDMADNISEWSSASSAIVKDTTAPGIPVGLVSKGYEDYIALKWKPNPEPDIAGYVIYRSLCHLGSWVECLPHDTCKLWITYNPSGKSGDKGMTPGTFTHMVDDNNRLPCPCSGPFVYLGEVTSLQIQKAVEADKYFFEDHYIPAGSPVCYAYWVKAKDSSDNVSGTFPIPSIPEQHEIQCERLHDLTPPEKAIISGLFAQSEQIRIKWIGPPTQDTRAYHVYRAIGKDPTSEPLVADYKWVGGMTVELPPVLPKVLTAPYRAPSLATCDKISVQSTPWMSEGSFEDQEIKPKITYWYRVVGIDYDGNETPVDSAAAISTFTFSRKMPDTPVMNTPIAQNEPCGVTITWLPVFDAAKHNGFIVYRGLSANDHFVPVVVRPIKGNTFTDTNIVKGQTYWYRIALLLLNGRLSAMSSSQSLTP